jgi:acyl-coenzyme A thioesterase 13
VPEDQDELARKIDERIQRGTGTGYNTSLGARVVSYGEGQARLEMEVTPDVQNVNGTLHGGAIATLVDRAGTVAIITADRQGRPGVSTDLNVSFLASAPAGATVVAEARVLKIGKTLAFVEVDVRRVADGVLVAQGRMTKYQG